MIWSEEVTKNVRNLRQVCFIDRSNIEKWNDADGSALLHEMVTQLKLMAKLSWGVELESQDIEVWLSEDYFTSQHRVEVLWKPSSLMKISGGPRDGEIFAMISPWGHVNILYKKVAESLEYGEVCLGPSQWDPENRVVIYNWPEEA